MQNDTIPQKRYWVQFPLYHFLSLISLQYRARVESWSEPDFVGEQTGSGDWAGWTTTHKVPLHTKIYIITKCPFSWMPALFLIFFWRDSDKTFSSGVCVNLGPGIFSPGRHPSFSSVVCCLPLEFILVLHVSSSQHQN